jgi:hypothetical protein
MTTVPQPKFAATTSFDELPETVERVCCRGKSCAPTKLFKFKNADLDGVYYGYARGNDEEYFATLTVTDLVEKLNDPDYWPTAQ